MFLEKDNCASKELIFRKSIQKIQEVILGFFVCSLKLSNIIILNQINIQVNLVFHLLA
jgi:hypothetical protein